MVADKARLTMGLQKTPSNPKQKTQLPYSSNSSQKDSVSRSFGVYFPRSSAQVQPRPPDVTELLRLVEELRERESRLKIEVLELKLLNESAAVVPKLENEIVSKNEELRLALKEVEDLRNENEGNVKRVREMEQVIAELKRTARDEIERNENRVREMKEEIAELKKTARDENERNENRVREMKEEIAELKKTARDENERNENRVREMKEEIAELKKTASFKPGNDEFFLSASQRFQGLMEASVRSNLIKNLKRNNGRCTDAVVKAETSEFKRDELLDDQTESDQRPSHSGCSNSEELVESTTVVKIRSRVPRVPKPPPIPPSSSTTTSTAPVAAVMQVEPPPPPTAFKTTSPPPPPPPPKSTRAVAANVRRVPEVVEFYHSIMRRDSKRDSGGSTGPEGLLATANARDMIGEIENRSAYLIAIKTDVETQGDFIRFLIKEVENVSFTDIVDVVPFVKWLDDELSYLVDERAVLKHFNWPEQKADALRDAAFGYCDLKKLESDASSFKDDPRQPCSPALKKMQSMHEKLEHGVYNLCRMRESAMNKYKGFRIPTDWMLETGIVSQIKLASVKLAMKYMRRVSAELEPVGGGPQEAELIVQGVRFAFRVHQFAGGFDGETMRAFQELRDKARSCHVQFQNQHHKLICRSTPC